MADRSNRPDSSHPESSSSSHTPPPRSPLYNQPSSIRPPTAGETLNPLFAPIGHHQHSHHALHPSHAAVSPQPTQIPEKCLTFCSQRADAPPMCRMFCLRRRPRQPSREEDLARLRPRNVRSGIPSMPSDTSDTATSSSSSSSARATSTSSPGPSTMPSFASVLDTLAYPFHALARAVDPYSIIYVRGTPDGVVGRYMEEMEFDDGNRDFGNTISRHGEQKGRTDKEMEYLSWGDDGALLHLPLTSIFRPVTSIPSTLSFLLTPSYNMVNRYVASWSDGTQSRGARTFFEAIYNLDAITFWGRIWAHHEARVQRKIDENAKLRAEVEETRAQERAARAEAEEQVKQAQIQLRERERERQRQNRVNSELELLKQADNGETRVAQQSQQPQEGEQMRFKQEIDRLKSGSGGSSLRRTIEEAMERDEEFRRRNSVDRGGSGSSGTSAGRGNESGNQQQE